MILKPHQRGFPEWRSEEQIWNGISPDHRFHVRKAVGGEIGCAILDGAKLIIMQHNGMAMVDHDEPG
jgi:hypothetical protein